MILERHNKAISAISAAVKQFHANKVPFRISHGSTNSTRNRKLPPNSTLDLSALNSVLHVDTASRTALVEPNVPMDRLVETTLKYGLVPPVVMEFPGITVGGGYAGTSGESSSFRHGFFNKTIREVELVLGDGEVVKASEGENADLFHGAAGAVGSLGITTMVKLQLVQAKKFVKTTYHPIAGGGGVNEAIKMMEELRKDESVEYMDGIMYDKDHGMVITGTPTDEAPADHALQRFTRPKDPWFYLHVQDILRKNSTTTVTETVPLEDYLFRYDRGGFWVAKHAFDYFKPVVPFNKHTRRFLDDFLRTRMLYSALKASGHSDEFVVQDLALPYETAGEFVEFCDKEFGIYPLWLCPLKQSAMPTMHPHRPDNKSIDTPSSSETDSNPSAYSSAITKHEATLKPMMNIGLWGSFPNSSNRALFLEKNLALESKLRALGGMKWLYACTYYTSSEFWSQFDKSAYDALRKKYRAEGLPSVFDKVSGRGKGPEQEKEPFLTRVRKMWPINGLWAVRASIKGGEWRKGRREMWKSIEEKDRKE